MPMLPHFDSGQLRPFSDDEVALMGIKTRGVRDGTGKTHSRKQNSSVTTMKWLCNFDQLDNFCIRMLGAVAVWSDTSGSTAVQRLSRISPYYLPGAGFMACTQLVDARFIKFTEDDLSDPQVPIPKGRYYDCTFVIEQVPFSWVDDDDVHGSPDGEQLRYVEILPSEGGAEYISVPGVGYGITYLRADGVALGNPEPHLRDIPFNIGYPFLRANVRRKQHRLPRAAWQAGSKLFERYYGKADGTVPGLIGTVNDRTVQGFAPGTLLLLPPVEEIWFDPATEEWMVNLTHQWEWKPRTHLALPWFPSKAQAAAGGLQQWCFAARGTTFYTPGTLPPGKALFDAANHNLVFEVG